MSSMKWEVRGFHVVVVQRNVQKSVITCKVRLFNVLVALAVAKAL